MIVMYKMTSRIQAHSIGWKPIAALLVVLMVPLRMRAEIMIDP